MENNQNKTPTNSVNENSKKLKNTWSMAHEVLRREHGDLQSLRGIESFAANCHSSPYIVERMKLSHHLDQPTGEVEVINFNSHGDLICVGCTYNEGKSNNIGLIDWAKNEVKTALSTENGAKLSDVNFLNAENYNEQLNIVSVYGNGHIRCDRLTPTGLIETWKSYKLSVESHKLALCPGKYNEILSASNSGKIFNIDLRCDHQETFSSTVLAETIPAGTNVRLQAVSHHPLAPQLCASYDDYYVRVFDKRQFDRPLHEICPEHLKPSSKHTQISDCFYNYDGSEILSIFTDTDIYLVDSENRQPGEFKQKFSQMGYLAGFTNKTCFFGPKSEYVVVGDDGQRIAFIDKITGEYVGHTALWPHGRFCSVYFLDLKSHPHLPIVAASAGHFSILSPTSVDRDSYTELPPGKQIKPSSKAIKPKKLSQRHFFQSGKQCNMQ